LDSTLIVQLLVHSCICLLLIYLFGGKEHIFSSFDYVYSKLWSVESPSWYWYNTCQAGVLLSHASRDYSTDVPDDWDIDNDGAAVSQLQVNDGATM